MSQQFPDVEWDLQNSEGKIASWQHVSIGVLMDIRRELRTLNRLLACPNFLNIPLKLDRIARNTTKTRKRRP